MQALKMFTGGGEHAQGMGGHGGGMGSGSMGGGSSEGKFIGMAMAQASKLFDEQHGSGKVVSLPSANICSSLLQSLPIFVVRRLGKSGGWEREGKVSHLG